MNKQRMYNQVAVVTGGGHGIGQAIARRFAVEGAKVAIWEVDDQSGQATVAAIKSDGYKASSFLCDVSIYENVVAAADATETSLGKVSILVNNAGVAHIGTVEDTSEEDFDRVQRINVKGPYNCMKVLVPRMVKNGSGSILNLASIASKLGLAERFAYSASKGAVLAMTLSVAKDYVDKGIRCNCICPGRVHTPFVDGYLEKYYPDDDERAKAFRALSDYQPMGRMGKPEEIANLAAFLCSDEASFITGSAYDVDGGTILIR
ncbi:MAG TPA: short-chain dehydrogenase [Chloroflexi bacterium]|nr:short-chain dehydrogenase [Chloroflexota bacterium]|tara:strand:- start:133 stop:918 length:786 start_codon:yes stop_codon:yes gene_type:complete